MNNSSSKYNNFSQIYCPVCRNENVGKNKTLISKCNEAIMSTQGTIEILKKRKNKYNLFINFVLITSLIVPISSYLFVSTKFGYFSGMDESLSKILEIIFWFAGAGQLLLSIILIANKFDDKKAHVSQSIEKNLEVQYGFKEILYEKTVLDKENEIKSLWKKYHEQDMIDTVTLDLSKKELQGAMTYILYKNDKECPKCDSKPDNNTIPMRSRFKILSLVSNVCDNCGQIKVMERKGK